MTSRSDRAAAAEADRARALLEGARRAGGVKVLVVGCGGIGCELLKNLVTSGFVDITMIDLDTVDVSNLNRQFLFHKVHVGKSKALSAKESLQLFNPDAKLLAIHDSIMSTEYNVSWFKRFDLVLNALDNRQARCHVNRMCLAADVPLVESGSAGYLGQVTVIKKGLTECYECQPKPHQKTFPGCTIRNTPSEPIHCIVWAKHLFNQLFGEEDPDEDVSPDTEDPEAGLSSEKNGEEGENGATASSNGDSAAETPSKVNRVSTRQWAREIDYDAGKLFDKFFGDDVRYLLSMEKLWAERRPPEPRSWNELPGEDEQTKSAEIADQAVWSLKECGKHFQDSLATLYSQLKAKPDGDHLSWDKDDPAALDFVVAVANFRCQAFHIPRKSRFDVKSMAGNIIPAIATTNAEIGGLIVQEALKILGGGVDNIKRLCSTLYLTVKPNARGLCVVPCQLEEPRPSCYVCSSNEVTVHLDTTAMTIKDFEEKVLKKKLNFAQPDVVVDGKGIILISSEEGETEVNNPKTMAEMKVENGAILAVEDFLQDFKVKVIVYHRDADKFEEGQEFEIEGEVPKAEEEEKKEEKPSEENGSSKNGGGGGDVTVEETRKRKSDDPQPVAAAEKRKKIEAATAVVEDDDDLVCLD